jgi:hypothetical protein
MFNQLDQATQLDISPIWIPKIKKLKVTAAIGNKHIGPYEMLNQSYQPTQRRHFSHLDTPYQQ